ncbi:ABC transporter permease [Desulforhopalus sp. 52FAK]
MSRLNPEKKTVISNPPSSAPLFQLVLLLGPALVVVAFLFGGGLLLGLFQALGWNPTGGLDNLNILHFKGVITDPDFLTSLGLTLYIALTSTLIAAIVSIFLALAINRWAGNNTIIHFLLQIPLAAPHLVIGISVIFLLAPSGMVTRLLTSIFGPEIQSSFPILVNDNWSLGIILVYVWKEIPFITLMLLAVLKNMGNELHEVGATLKATPLQRFRYITLPIIGPNLSGACCIVFAFTFGAFEIPYLLGKTYPLTLPVWAYQNYSDIDLLSRPEGIGIGLIIAVIVIISVLLAERMTSRTLKSNA